MIAPVNHGGIMKRLIQSSITLLIALAPLGAVPYDRPSNHSPINFYDEDCREQHYPDHSPASCYGEDCRQDDFCEIDYLKLGGALVTIGKKSSFVPVLGFGRRCECPEMGVDYSARLGYAKGIAGNERSVFLYTIPKILALKFVDPCSNFSLYFGGGGSWTGIVNNNENQAFHGVFAEAVIGYELQRQGSMRTFIQLEVNQGILAAYRKGKYPTPTALLTFSIGF